MGGTNLIIDTFEKFSSKGWMPGKSGALAMMTNITENSKKIYITPEQTNKAKLTANDLFLFRDLYGSQDVQQPLNQSSESLTLSRWAAVFFEIIKVCPKVSAVAQISTKWSALAGRLALAAWKKNAENHPNIVRLAHWALLDKLTTGHELLLPVINFSDPESMLSETKSILSLYPNTCAILIRDYGMVTWGASFNDVENKIEILEHVCELQIYSYALLSSVSLI